MTTRRDFLCLPLVLGLPGCSRPDAPRWLDGALRQLRESERPALLLRLPPEKETRCALGHGITRFLLNSADPDVHEVLSEAALLCMDGVDSHFVGARRSDTLLLVDGHGYVLDGVAFQPGDTWEGFVPAARALLHGPGGRRLAERAERARGRASKADLALLAKPELDPAGALLPLLVKERLGAAGARGEALRAAVEARWASDPKMPYGVETTLQQRGGCGNCGCEEAPARDLMVACGMALAARNSRHFVKFLAK